ncbi:MULTISPECIES: TetR/AcrR family transcriptional regulator [Mesobacillus]|uniref:TetR family transcriptional regulator n=2 Tax=Mesobacillus TaxID=2675231 RepID=A0A0D6Z9L0_9BACI|nr:MULTISPECIES: TetR/AcrR family transcriptional regulator [Mesobacillus]KIY21253.1 TetR family transcriptional regulator [Mesobacillus subterraneus]MDQ0415460.1 AcrR family transcriptional regulator [Mesobacillus stamsii]
MRDKTDQIIKAAIHVFIKKGFLQSTTQEIAKEANVAEVTLYRKFSTKQNLFETVIKKSLENHFKTKIFKLAEEETGRFFEEILDERLVVISKNHQLIKMLISESLLGNLTGDLNFPSMIYDGLKAGIQLHFDKQNIAADPGIFAHQITGILLSNVLFVKETPYYQLTKEEKRKVLDHYTNSLKANL